MGKERIRQIFKDGETFEENLKIDGRDWRTGSVSDFIAEEYSGEGETFKLKVVSYDFIGSEDITVVFEFTDKLSGEVSHWKFKGYYNSYSGSCLTLENDWSGETFYEVKPVEKMVTVWEKK